MQRSRRRNAFTLIEVLIVVVIMAVLAAVIIPQLSSSTKDAQNNTAVFNAHTMRAQIELYKSQHRATPPKFATLADQLTKYSDMSGATVATQDATHPFGPYVTEIPTNPANGKNTVAQFSGTPKNGDDSTGWQYDEATGAIWPNHNGWTPPTP